LGKKDIYCLLKNICQLLKIENFRKFAYQTFFISSFLNIFFIFTQMLKNLMPSDKKKKKLFPFLGFDSNAFLYAVGLKCRPEACTKNDTATIS
jgi:hypothetical protein